MFCSDPECMNFTEGNTPYCGSCNRAKRKEDERRKRKELTANKVRSNKGSGEAGNSPKDSPGVRVKKPGYIKPRSTKRAREEREYLRRRDKFLLMHPVCQVKGCKAPSGEIHHSAGRTGKMLINVMYFLAVCREHHIQIETRPDWAKQEGYSINRLTI